MSPRPVGSLSLLVCVCLAASIGSSASASLGLPAGSGQDTGSASASGAITETRQAIARVLDAKAPPAERAETLRALGTHAAVMPDDRAMVRDAATRVLDSGLTEIRTAAVDTLGATGPEAVPALTRAMTDYHYEVRAGAANALGRIGRPSLPAVTALVGSLDPFLGAAAEAGAALIAIGPEALPIVEARARAAAPTDRARPVLVAVMFSLRHGRNYLADTLDKELPRGPNGKGFVLIEPLRTTGSGTRYEPEKHRIQARFNVLHYGAARKIPLDMQETRFVAWQGVNTGLAALAGRRAGDRVRLLMSPDIAQSLVFGTSKHSTWSRTHVSGTTGYFDVTIDRVCEPQIWTLFSGGEMWGPWKFELSCRN